MAGNLTDLMDDMGTALSGITGLRVFDFPPKSAQPPFAFVDMPDGVAFDAAMKRGLDRVTVNVVVCVSSAVDRSARDAIAAYAAGSGASSVKAVLEAASVGDSLRVTDVQFRSIILAGTMYFGAVFAVDVTI